jgi:hypothetical protein
LVDPTSSESLLKLICDQHGTVADLIARLERAHPDSQ